MWRMGIKSLVSLSNTTMAREEFTFKIWCIPAIWLVWRHQSHHCCKYCWWWACAVFTRHLLYSCCAGMPGQDVLLIFLRTVMCWTVPSHAFWSSISLAIPYVVNIHPRKSIYPFDPPFSKQWVCLNVCSQWLNSICSTCALEWINR